ncbi:MAG: hypothetical protein LBM99_01380 [Bacillales bacterium]|jgi:hypothetical protein|nr:hypothetical protein [Bacillales bacterium]
MIIIHEKPSYKPNSVLGSIDAFRKSRIKNESIHDLDNLLSKIEHNEIIKTI